MLSFLSSTALDELARRLAESVPESLRSFGRDLEGNFKAVLQAQLSKLDLVSRQEFDVQAALLARTQEKLAALDQRLQELERNPWAWIAGRLRPPLPACIFPRRDEISALPPASRPGIVGRSVSQDFY